MNYKIIIMYDTEYQGYVVDVPALSGCMSQGKSMDEALENIKDAINGWLYVERKHNRVEETELRDIFIGEITV